LKINLGLEDHSSLRVFFFQVYIFLISFFNIHLILD
jgi:hypothetical protein